jgi:hypothetical protein
MNQEFDILDKVRPVDAPPFLYTRILQRVQALRERPIPLRWKLTWAAAGLFVLLLNVGTLLGEGSKKQVPPADSGAGVGGYVNTINDIYND